MKLIALDHCRAGGHGRVSDQRVGCSAPVGLWVFGWLPSSFTSKSNKVPESSLPLFVKLWAPVKQTNLNRLVLAVDPVLIGGLCNVEAVVTSNISIKDTLIPSRYIPKGTGLPKNLGGKKKWIIYGETAICCCHLWPLCHSCDAHKNTHTHTVSSRSEVRAWHGKPVRVPELSHSWRSSFRLLFPPSYSFHPSHFPLTTGSSLPVGSPSHTAVSQCCIVRYMLISVVKASDFGQKSTKVCDVAQTNSDFLPHPLPVQQIPLSGIIQLSHVVAFWLIAPKLVFMKHPTLPCLFALCCVLTINLAPGAASFSGSNTSCFVTVCMCACAHDEFTHAFDDATCVFLVTLSNSLVYVGPLKKACSLRSESGIPAKHCDLLMSNRFRSYWKAFRALSVVFSSLISDLSRQDANSYCNLE